jgi:hypothetical protein
MPLANVIPPTLPSLVHVTSPYVTAHKYRNDRAKKKIQTHAQLFCFKVQTVPVAIVVLASCVIDHPNICFGHYAMRLRLCPFVLRTTLFSPWILEHNNSLLLEPI